MTIPLLISESVPKEISNILKSLKVGMPARYKEFEGTIEFVDDAYITLCISKKENPPGYRQPYNKCCMCIYPQYWDDLEIEDEHFYDHKSFRGKTEDHPGNDMLPDLNKR
jgi:hypothetical protein